MVNVRRWALLVLMLCLLTGCGGGGSPLERLRRELDKYPEYSVILEDMRTQGVILHDYFHRYRLIYLPKGSPKTADGVPDMAQKMTDWVKVDETIYKQYEPALGMVILAKKADGSLDKTPQPPGFAYVGDSRFGRWENDDQGNQVWKWLATSMVLSEVVDEVGDFFEKRQRRIDYRDWQEYRRSSSSGTPYFGRRGSDGRTPYGTQGTVTQKKNPSFFERQQARMAEKKTTFAEKVESRMGRKVVGSGRSTSMPRGRR